MATKQRSTADAEKTDFRQEFTDKVVAAIDAGQKLPWEKPWVSGMAPSNAVTGKEYNGMNRLILGVHMLDKGYTDPRFVTFKQALALEGGVNKGEKGVQIERWDTKPFWKRSDVEISMGSTPVSVRAADAAGVHLTSGQTVAPERLRVTHNQRTDAGILVKDYSWAQAERTLNLLVGRAYTVFNVEQCRDLKLEPLPVREPVAPEARLLHIQQAMTEQTGLQFADGPAAMYVPGRDTVVTPKPEMFKSLGDYQSTMLHEIGHATGAEKRLNRPTLTEPAKFGSATYAKEELRAELFSAFAAMETGITRTRDEQHHAYLQSWAETLKKDKNEIFRAARDAAEAVDYVKEQEQAYDLKIDRIYRSLLPSEPTKPVEIDPPGLARITPDQIKPGLDLVDKEGRMSRVLDVKHAPGGTATTMEQDLDTGNQFHLTYRPGDKVLATTLSLSIKDPEQAVGPSVGSGPTPGTGDAAKKPLTLHEALESNGWKSTPHGSYEKTFLLDKDKSKGGEFTHGKGTVEKILNVNTRANGFVIVQGWDDIPVPVKDGLSPTERVAELDKAAKQLLMAEHGVALGVTAIRGKGEPEVQSAPSASDKLKEAVRREDDLLSKQPHELTFAEFATVATAQKLGPNHGREWAVLNGSAQRGELMGYAEGPTAEDALRMMHKNRVNNALYDNMPGAVHPPGMEPKSMPPQQVLNEYPDLKEKFAPAIKEHRQMLDKEDRKAAEYRDMTADQAPARIEDAGRLTGKLTRIEPTPDPQRDLIHVQRAGVDVSITVPAGKVSHDLVAGTPIKLRYEPKAGLQVEAGPQPARNKAMER